MQTNYFIWGNLSPILSLNSYFILYFRGTNSSSVDLICLFSICHFFSNCFILLNPLPISDSLRAVPQLKSFLHARIWFSNLFLIYDLEWCGLDSQFISLIWNFLLHLILFHYLISELFLYWIISSITLLYGKLCFLVFIPWAVFFFQAGFFVFCMPFSSSIVRF